MSKKNISQEKIIQAFVASAFEKSAGATSLADISENLEIKKASLYNHFSSRDEMYVAAVEYCGKEIASIHFLQEKSLESAKNAKTSLTSVFKKLTTRFFELYGNEPLFEMYVFIHTEQYFNYAALKVVEKEEESFTDEVKQLLQAFMAAEKIEKKSDRELKDLASALCSLIFQQRDEYIARRKETVRQNPESGAGSLFALPTDENFLNKTLKLQEMLLKSL
ncbi:MAG: TetR/AcrR family transcriptional regulator [Treponema sp.]|nr:TetR/AcrR family transcriptional regulator [Treponema sp.]